MVKLDIIHNLAPGKIWAEIRFDENFTIEQVKAKVAQHTGSQESTISLKLNQRGGNESTAVPMTDLSANLGSFHPQDGWRIEVTDSDPNSLVAELYRAEQGEAVASRYQMTDEEYLKRPGNAREFLENLKQQRPELFKRDTDKQGPAANEPPVAAIQGLIPLGGRCQVGDVKFTRGSVGWVGRLTPAQLKRVQWKYDPTEVPSALQTVVIINLDEPSGGNFDGYDADGKTEIVKCDHLGKRCLVVPYKQVVVGDFPELDPLDIDEF